MFLKKIVKIGNLMGIFPRHSEKSKLKLLSHNWLLSIIYILVAITVYYRGVHRRIRMNLQVIPFILENMYLCNLPGITLCCAFRSIWYRQQWVELFQNLSKIDTLMSLFKITHSNLKTHTKFFILHVIYVFQLLILTCLPYVYERVVVFSEYLPSTIFLYQRFYIVIVLYYILQLLEKRCNYMEIILQKAFFNTLLDRDRIFDAKLRKFKEILFVFKETVKLINMIFGLPILILIASSFTDILRLFEYILCYLFDVESQLEVLVIVSFCVHCLTVVSKFQNT